MSQLLIIHGKKYKQIILLVIFIISAFIWYSFQANIVPALTRNHETREIHMVTGEFSTKIKTGKEIKVYRFDPGTVFVKKDEKVYLKILGVSGEKHDFKIEGTNISGTIEKGKETVIPLQFKEKGIYRLICLTHETNKMNGPMIAYIVVE